MARPCNAPLLIAGLALGLTPAHALAQETEDTKPDRRSPVQRGQRPPADSRRQGGPGGPGVARFPQDLRTIDGSFNNVMHPIWGAVGVELKRTGPVGYADGVSEPAGPDRPSPRLISNLVVAQNGDDIPNTLGLSDFMWQWGQFLDHDIDETPITTPGEALDILVPAGDPWFDPQGTGTVAIPLDRSAWELVDGVRQQVNNITAYIDASNVYGSEEERTHELRAFDGTGRMKTSAGDLLPFNVNGFDNAPSSSDPSFFLAGDIRANEQVVLTAMHTLFVREHNYWADLIASEHPEYDGDKIFEHARAIVAAETQAITYKEFLPRLLGQNALPPYMGYRANIDASISNEFATAAYRVGHTMLSPQVLRINEAGEESDIGPLRLANAFFNPDEIIENGIDDLLRGLSYQVSQDVDNHVIDDVRNFLFGPPGAGGFDLASLNIQRGRDHGLASYNQIRMSVGRPPAMSFMQITPDPETQNALAAAYDHPSDVDAWVGLLSEPHRPGAFVGETLYRVIRDQFVRLRDGDRFWYRAYLPPDMVDLVEDQTLAVIIRRNTDIGMELADDVFVANDTSACVADLDGNGVVDVLDFLEVLSAWGACEGCNADINGDDFVDVTDLLAVLAGWGPC
ncbi:MAG: hypothetical protein KJO18_06505 [Acidimicrobiia bacterium]|nr:hypothetical protein [Acidimicrobiia bacterium]NNF43684.1 hypothetical protein [Phycisphaerales bacterium]